MNQWNEFPLVYFLITDSSTKKEIGSYLNKKITNTSSKSEIDMKEINLKFEEELRKASNPEARYKKNKISTSKYNLYFYLNKNNFFFSAVTLTGQINENIIYELIEDIEHQGVLKLVDKNKDLTNVGRQNLVYLIEKYLNEKSRSNSSGDQSFETNSYRSNKDRIITITDDVNEVKDNVKSGIKSLITNLEMATELEDKSMRINNNSLLFKKDSENLRKQTQWRNIRFLIVLVVIGIIITSYLIYATFS